MLSTGRAGGGAARSGASTPRAVRSSARGAPERLRAGLFGGGGAQEEGAGRRSRLVGVERPADGKALADVVRFGLVPDRLPVGADGFHLCRRNACLTEYLDRCLGETLSNGDVQRADLLPGETLAGLGGSEETLAEGRRVRMLL